jgi:hypothetical protein
MAACNSSGVKRRRSSIGATARALTRDHPGRKAGKPRPTSAERVRSDGEEPAKALSKLSTAIALVETISLAMRVNEHEPFDCGVPGSGALLIGPRS